MTIYETHPSPETADAASEPSQPAGRRGLRARITSWLATCADYYEAAMLYEEFRGLSDAELTRRGLNRATLARDACAACDRGADEQSG